MSASKKAAQSAAPKTKPTSATDKVPVLTDAPNASRAGRRISNKAVVLIILAVILAVLAFVALSYYQSQQTSRRQAEALAADKARFAKVEAEMAKAYERIVAAAGKPDKTETFKNCSRIAHKYDEGDLYCNLGYRFTYSSSDFNQIRMSAVKTDDVLREVGLVRQHNSPAVQDIEDIQDLQNFKVLYEKNHIFDECDIAVEFAKSAMPQPENYVLTQQFRCSSKTGQPVYTLAE